MSLATRAALLGGFLALCAVYLVWGWSHEISEFGGDSAGYILAARYFSPFQPMTPLLADYGRQIFYPPLFPWLIGLCGGSLLAGHLVVIASLLGAVYCLYGWLRQTGVSALLAGWAALLFALMPGAYLQALNIWTENTYLCLSLLAFWLVERAEAGDEDTRLWLWAAAAVAAGTLVRVAGLPLLVAFGLRVLLLRPRRWPWIIAAATAPFLAWAVWSRMRQVGVEGYTSQWAALYGDHWLAVLSAQLRQESAGVVTAWVQAWLSDTSSGALTAAVLALGAWCLLAWFTRLLRARYDALYALVYGLLLLAWPHPEEVLRYAYVLFPVLFAQGVWLLHRLAGRLPQSAARALPAAVLTVVTIVLLPALFLIAGRYLQPLPAEQVPARKTEAYYLGDPRAAARQNLAFIKGLELLHHVDDFVPPGQCVFATKPLLVELYSDRPSYAPPPASAADGEFEQQIGQCRFAYLTEFISPRFGQSFYPLQRLGPRASPLYVASEQNGDERKAHAILVGIDPPR